MSTKEKTVLSANAWALCETGLVREDNQDTCCIVDLRDGHAQSLQSEIVVNGPRGGLFLVCDGMGGRAGGEIASSLAAETIAANLYKSDSWNSRDELACTLRDAVLDAHQVVRRKAKGHKELKGMGTTVSAAAVAGQSLVLAQIGDSRAYILRDQKLTQVTRDQSVVSALVRAGELSEELAPYSMQKGRILQALGAGKEIVVSLSVVDLCEGDRLLLCSDGLHEVVSDTEISEACQRESLVSAGKQLMAMAAFAGAPDNVSILLVDFSGGGLCSSEKAEELQYRELDPDLDGEEALTKTSMVRRRLALEVGIGKGTKAAAPISNRAEEEIAKAKSLSWSSLLAIAAVLVLAFLFFLIAQV